MKRILTVIIAILSLFTIVGCSSEVDDYKLTIVSPAGSPGIALSSLYEKEEYDITFNATPQILQTTFMNKDVDCIVAPINLGINLYKSNTTYKLCSVITWGNLYIASQRENFKLEDINTLGITLFGEGSITDYITKYVLENKNISLDNISYLSDTSLTQAKLISSDDIVLIAEPALSAVKSKVSNITAYSVQELYSEITNLNSYPQAGLFIKADVITNHKTVVKKFLNDVKWSIEQTKTNLDNVSSICEELSLGKANILKEAIGKSNILYKSAKDSKLDIEYLITITPDIFKNKDLTGVIYEE